MLRKTQARDATQAWSIRISQKEKYRELTMQIERLTIVQPSLSFQSKKPATFEKKRKKLDGFKELPRN